VFINDTSHIGNATLKILLLAKEEMLHKKKVAKRPTVMKMKVNDLS
jgi:hypothetical protein